MDPACQYCGIQAAGVSLIVQSGTKVCLDMCDIHGSCTHWCLTHFLIEISVLARNCNSLLYLGGTDLVPGILGWLPGTPLAPCVCQI